jgi:hypothetical protein
LEDAFEAAKDIVVAPFNWNKFGHRQSSLGDYYGLPRGPNLVHNFQASCLELPRPHRFHCHHLPLKLTS